MLDHDRPLQPENLRVGEFAEQRQAQGLVAEGGVVRRVDIHGVEATPLLLELGDEELGLGVDQLYSVADLPVVEQLPQAGVAPEVRLNRGDASATTEGLEADLSAAGTQIQESLALESRPDRGKDRLLEPG